MAVNVLIFDDNKHIRESLTLLFETDDRFELAGAYDSAMQASEFVDIHKPDVVIMDIDMPGINGVDAVALLHQKFPTLPIIMLTVFDDVDRIYNSLRNGALGYLLKSTSPDKLLDAIVEVNEGGAPMSPAIARKVLTHFKVEDTKVHADYNLTAREKEVLSHLVEGLSYKMIAAELSISFETVRSHIKKIYEKLHVQTMTEAVTKTLREKLI
jgi:DNA-binding NarL/FixJ family response regulator